MVQIFRKGKYFFAMKKRKLGPVLFSNRSFQGKRIRKYQENQAVNKIQHQA